MTMETVPWIDLIGFFGGGVTLWGMNRKTIIPLRFGAVGGNAVFLIFGLVGAELPDLGAARSSAATQFLQGLADDSLGSENLRSGGGRQQPQCAAPLHEHYSYVRRQHSVQEG